MLVPAGLVQDIRPFTIRSIASGPSKMTRQCCLIIWLTLASGRVTSITRKLMVFTDPLLKQQVSCFFPKACTGSPVAVQQFDNVPDFNGSRG